MQQEKEGREEDESVSYKKIIVNILKTLVLCMFAFIILFPFYQLVISSFLQSDMSVSYPPKYWPKGGNLDNYVKVLTDNKRIYLRWLLNSFVTAGISTVAVIILSTMAGFAFAKREQVSLLAIFTFTGSWGNYMWLSVVISSNKMKTIPLGIASMKDLTGSITGEIMAASVISFIPLLIAFMCAKDQFIEGMTIGAVKG